MNIKTQIEDVKENARSIEYMKNPIKKVQLEAVKINPFAIQYIKNPNILQLEAVRECPDAIKWINNPCKEAKLAIKSNL